MAKLSEYYSILGTAQQTRFEAQKKELEEERKRARRDRYLGYLAKPVLGAISEEVVDIIKSPFEKKYEDFSNNVSLMQAKAKQKYSDRQTQGIYTTDKEASSYATGQTGFFNIRGEDEVKRTLIAQDPENEAKINSGFYDAYIKEQGAIRGAALLEDHRQRVKLADSYSTSGNVEDFFVNRRSKGILARGLDFFQGDTVEKQDQRAEEAYKKSLQYKNMDAFITYEESRKNGNSIAMSAQAAKELILPESAYDEDFFTETRKVVIDNDGNKKIEKIKRRYNRTSESWKRNQNPIDETIEIDNQFTPEKEAEIEKELVINANREFNFVSKARSLFTPAVYERFERETAAAGINLTNIKTVDERLKVGEIFNRYDRSENMQTTAVAEAREAARKTDIQTRLMENDIEFRTAYREWVKNPTSATAEANYNREFQRIQDYYEAASSSKMPVRSGSSMAMPGKGSTGAPGITGSTGGSGPLQPLSPDPKSPPKLSSEDEKLIQAAKPGESGTLSNGMSFTKQPDGSVKID